MQFTQRIDDELELAFLQMSMAEEFKQLVDDNREYLSQWMPWTKDANTLADTEKFIKDSIAGFKDQKTINVVIVYNGKIVGITGYNSILPEVKKVAIGYWLAAECQGKGIMTRCVKYLIQNAFDNMGMEKVEIEAAVENKLSRAVIERVGGTLEGIIKNAENLHGKIVDHAVYGVYKA
ncbi:MAG: GNAT family N-acetyltransferase [Rhizobiales bacterium]|nr:GNAT family N-acetyltransferase [Hyphomicrobiales bacterium]NRB14643.1 GNAT family N-acetyltransferase [Hyphomicrobiales bacterium]